MLNVILSEVDAVVTLEPKGKLREDDFSLAAKVIDPFIEKYGKLKGIIIYVKDFQGWDSFKGLLKHLEFIKEHHKKVSRVALVTDSIIGDFAEHLGSHFVYAEVKKFSFDALKDAKQWVREDNKKV